MGPLVNNNWHDGWHDGRVQVLGVQTIFFTLTLIVRSLKTGVRIQQ
jgi:hypothetical protein